MIALAHIMHTQSYHMNKHGQRISANTSFYAGEWRQLLDVLLYAKVAYDLVSQKRKRTRTWSTIPNAAQ